ncbi:type II toxin-antitoxin system VapC family toxin [Candidatus Pacearchaeota archaeon]|nr:type II toxin-antitoxin system VapC family toxin [Candidatus Pacearchaeota archaeon]
MEKMVRKICLDSDIIIELLKNNLEVIKTINSLDAEFYATVVNIFEIWTGRMEKESKTIIELISELNILDFDRKSALRAGDIRKKLKGRGELIEIRDIFIASICIQNNMELLTYNKKHFERLKQFELKLVN